MKRLNANTALHRRVLPVQRVSLFVALTVAGLVEGVWVLALTGALLAVAMGVVAYRDWHELPDAVHLADDHLVVDLDAQRYRIPLEQIADLSSRKARVTIRFRPPAAFGDELEFIAETRIFARGVPRCVRELRDRIGRIDDERRMREAGLA